jgi:hypothetical protein
MQELAESVQQMVGSVYAELKGRRNANRYFDDLPPNATNACSG